MKFDTQAPGEGMEIFTKLENGKVLLEFSFYLKEQEERWDTAYVDVHLYDREKHCVMRFTHPFRSEEPARGILLHPHLWNSVEDPYFYQVDAYLVTKEGPEEVFHDQIRRLLPLCTLQRIPGRDWLLNGSSFPLKAVGYTLPLKENTKGERTARLLQDLQRLEEMGANAVCLSGGKLSRDFYEMCCRQGLAVLCAHGKVTVHVTLDELLDGRRLPVDAFYYYKALWSREPFVYLCRDSLVRQENGLYQITVYSNLKKVALYVEGIPFEFQSGAPEFLFSDVEIRRFPAALTAEAESCSMSVTVYPTVRS